MANISAIKLPNNTTYNLVDKTSGYVTLEDLSSFVKESYTGASQYASIGYSEDNDTVYTGMLAIDNDSVNQAQIGITPSQVYMFGPQITMRYVYSGIDYTQISIGSTVAIHRLVTPTANTDAANKKYVDDAIGGITVTDEKLQVEAVISGYTYYPILTRDSTIAAIRQYDVTGLKYNNTNGTTSAIGSAELVVGNNTASGTANNKRGRLSIYGEGTHFFTLKGNPTSNRSIDFPDKSGTVALTSDVPIIPDTTGDTDTGITISNHSTTTIFGVQSSTTTASKVTIGSHSTDYGVTAAGSGSASLTFTMDTTDTKKLKITFSHTHTAPTLGSKVPTVSASNVIVPIRDSSPTTVVTSGTHNINDPGHGHSI